jgi:ADP-ribose pyrophosphatase YjhB (NUDIX family)
MKERAVAVLIKDGAILLIHRIKPHEDYYTLPGGSVEEGETIEEAMIREIKEELSIDAALERLLFTTESDDRKDHYFLVGNYSGAIALGGPEKERMNTENQYHLVWVTEEEARNMDTFYPKPPDAKERILALLGGKVI